MFFFCLWCLSLVLAVGLIAVAYRMARREMDHVLDENNTDPIDPNTEYPSTRIKVLYGFGIAFAVVVFIISFGWVMEIVFRGISIGVSSVCGV